MRIFFLILSLFLIPISLSATPTAPKNLTLTPTATTVLVGWEDTSSTETGFKIFRNDKLIAVTKPNTTSFLDTGLTPNTKYKYEVRATDDKVYVLVGKANVAENKAADVLINYLKKSTGVDAVKTENYTPQNGIYFVVGKENSYAKSLQNKIKFSNLGEDGFEIRRDGNTILIAGAYGRGTLYGVYQYLREYMGWEWYSWDDDGSRTKDIDSIVFPKDFKRYMPRFIYREVFSYEGGNGIEGSDGTTFAVKMMLNGQLNHRYIEQYLKEKHGFGVDVGQVCDVDISPIISDLDNMKQKVADGVDFMYSDAPKNSAQGDLYKRPDNNKKGTILTYGMVEHFDGSVRSSDQSDLTYASEHESEGAPLFKLTREAASQLKDRYPYVKLLAQAYLWSLKPPKDLDLGDAGVMFAPIELDWSSAIDQGLYNKSYYNYFKEWGNHTNYMVLWLYITNFQGYLQPLPTIYAMGETIKSIADSDYVKGVLLQGSYDTKNGSFSALKAWVFAKLLWDPTLDTDKLVKEFCNGYYGPKAGRLIYEYIELLHDSIKERPSPILTKTNVLQPYINSDFVIEADALFQRAEEVAENDWYKKHVQIERLGVDWIILQNSAYLKQEAIDKGDEWVDESDDDFKRRYQRFKDRVLNVAGITSFQEGGEGQSFNDVLESLSINRVIPQRPTECADVDKDSCIDRQELSFELADTQIVADSDASDHGAARIVGSTDSWGIQLPLKFILPNDDSSWDIYAVVKVEKGSGVDGEKTAFSVGVDGFTDDIKYKLKDLPDNRYITIKIPGTPYKYDNEAYIWFAPPNSDAIKYLYVDRIFAIKKGAQGSGSSGEKISAKEASAFLSRATFGSSESEISKLQKMGYEVWIEEQFKQAPSYHMNWALTHAKGVGGVGDLKDNPNDWRKYADGLRYLQRDAWWDIVVHAPDQLRQRVAFALSEIMVVSIYGPLLTEPDSRMSYYDVLVKNAFGNFEDLLHDVTYHPAMGKYLSYLGNAKADPQTGSHPDENYAREVMQLFTIGLYELNQDGTPKLDKNGKMIPTYMQRDVKEMARVFTGLTDQNGYFRPDEGGTSHKSKTSPMIAMDEYHDKKEKHILGKVIKANGTTNEDIKEALNILFMHHNTAPFISKQLIQRLVTSNPSPDYVNRVAEVFKDNGKGVRGDLKAVVKAILLDDEALHGRENLPNSFGKFREPLLTISHLFRAFNAQNGVHTLYQEDKPLYRYRSFNFNGTDYTKQEGPLEAYTVFNYFTPTDAPYSLKKEGLVAPELTVYGTQGLHELLMALIHQQDYIYNLFDITSRLQIDKQISMVHNRDFDGLLDNLDTLLTAGNLSSTTKEKIKSYLQKHTNITDENLTRHAIGLVMVSPDYALQR
jgi:uncharacterized protein (DUF1800 family)